MFNFIFRNFARGLKDVQHLVFSRVQNLVDEKFRSIFWGLL